MTISAPVGPPALPSKVSIDHLLKMTAQRDPIVMLTAYDFPSAQVAQEAGVDIIFVGDSVAMVMLGYESTVPVSLEEMLVFMRAVARGARTPLLLGDMPFGTYLTPEQGLGCAARLLKEGGMDAVKLEGGRMVADVVRALSHRGIPVMGHIGLTPQTAGPYGGFKRQGRTASRARELVEDALALQAAGAFGVVLELVPDEVAAAISAQLEIPTIGIGSGPRCDGQVLVWHDALGWSTTYGRHVRPFADLRAQTLAGLQRYVGEVRSGDFPGPDQTFHMSEKSRSEFIGGN
jgi:3-methyl-2-oxobutanoate hydroxymethyltransferase